VLITFGLDIAKRVFQLHSLDPDTGEIQRLKLRRAEMVPFFANRAPVRPAVREEQQDRRG
jgi:transposase